MLTPLPVDRRFKVVKDIYAKAYAQMQQYFLCRYSFGQVCCHDRANDWAVMCQSILTQQIKSGWYEMDSVDMATKHLFPSGSAGTISSLVNNYHDGWQLLVDLGLHYDSYDDLP